VGVKDIDSLTIDDIKPLTISFKKAEDDLILYKWVLKKCRSGKSGYIKDILRELMESEGVAKIEPIEIKQPRTPVNDNNNLIDLNF
jgi:hypothetical protein